MIYLAPLMMRSTGFTLRPASSGDTKAREPSAVSATPAPVASEPAKTLSGQVDALVAASPRPNAAATHRAIDSGAVEDCLARYFGPLDQLTPPQARRALTAIAGVPQVATPETRPALVTLRDRLAARANAAWTAMDVLRTIAGWRLADLREMHR